MPGCGLLIGEALAVNIRCRINHGKTLRVKEQVNPTPGSVPALQRRGRPVRRCQRGNTLPPWAGFGLLCGYAAVVIGAAVLRLRRTDA
jgi:hypothetical protein